MKLAPNDRLKHIQTNDVLVYVKTIISANQPVFVFLNSSDKEVTLTRFTIKEYIIL